MEVARHGRWWEDYPRLTRGLVSLMLLGSMAGIVVPAGINWDFGNFYDAGRRILAGETHQLYLPTSLVAGTPPQATTGFWGTPLSAYLYVPIALFPPLPAMMFFKVQTAFFNIGGLLLLYRHNLRFVDERDRTSGQYAALFALVSLAYQPLWTAFRTGGQTTPMVFFLLALALIAASSGRQLQSAIWFVCAVMIKPVLITALGVFVLLAGLRYLRYTVVLFAGLGVASLAVLGWPIHQEFLELMVKGVNKSVPWMYNSGLGTTVESLKLLTAPDSWPRTHVRLLDAINAGARLAAALTCAWILYRGRERAWSGNARRHFYFLVALSVWALLGHIIYEAYLSFLFLPLIYALAARRHFSVTARRLVAAIFALALFQNIVWVHLLVYLVDVTTTLEVLAISLFKSAPLILYFTWLAYAHDDLLNSYDTDAWRSPPGLVPAG